MDSLLPAFDINDMIAGRDKDRTLADIFLYPEKMLELKTHFEQFSCGEGNSCELKHIKDVIDENLNQILNTDSSHIFLGRIYRNDEGSNVSLQSLLWAFRESRQSGVRRFYVDGFIKEFPSFNNASLEEEVLSLGQPKIMASLECSLSIEDESEKLSSSVFSFMEEKQVGKNFSQEAPLFLAIAVQHKNSEYKIEKLFPLNGDVWCDKCSFGLMHDAQGKGKQFNFSSEKELDNCDSISISVLGHSELELKNLLIRDLYLLIENKGSFDKLLTPWKKLVNSSIGDVSWSEPIRSLSFLQLLELQLALIESTEINGVTFLLEMQSVNFVSTEKYLKECLSVLIERGNNFVIGLTEVDSLKNDLDFSALVSGGTSPLLVDIFNLREKIFKLYSTSRDARVISFSSKEDLKKKEFLCLSCKGKGFHCLELPFAYNMVSLCEVCSGVGCSKEMNSIKTYGVSLLHAFGLSFFDFHQIFKAEPGFIDIQLEEELSLYSSDLRLNSLIPDLSFNSRIHLQNILKNRLNSAF